MASVTTSVTVNRISWSRPMCIECTKCRGDANRVPVNTSIAASAASGISCRSPGASATNPSRNAPCRKLDFADRAPASMFALLRTISLIIGRPPIAAATRLPTPSANRSRLRSLARFFGSSPSTARQLSVDSIVPTSANMTTYLIDAPDRICEKSGSAITSSSEPGRRTRNCGPTSNFSRQNS